MPEIALFIKRKSSEEFAGDKTWQQAPYPIKDVAHAERLYRWLQKAMPDIELQHMIVSEASA